MKFIPVSPNHDIAIPYHQVGSSSRFPVTISVNYWHDMEFANRFIMQVRSIDRSCEFHTSSSNRSTPKDCRTLFFNSAIEP